MTFKIDRMISPNRTDRIIPVEFLVLHYTSVNLQRTMEIFMTPDKVSAHLVIDRDGSIVEVVNCLDGKPLRAWHAGVSHWQEWESFNDFAIGIELVNYNGNLFEYSEAQYQSLQQVVTSLKQFYPALQNPERVLGHEQIAGHRGKIDPGICFDWHRFFRENYFDQSEPDRKPGCLPETLKMLRAELDGEPKQEDQKNPFWESVSVKAESSA